MKLRNLTSDKTFLYNGKQISPGAEFNDLSDPCSAITELLRIKQENNLSEITLEPDYLDFISKCPTLQNDSQSLIPPKPEGVPPIANNPPPEGEETSESLGREFVFPPVELGQTPSESSPEVDNTDPNIPAQQAPPAGEAEERSKDEEKQKTIGADPVNLFSGEFYLEKVDFELPSVGFPFVFVRSYKSGRTYFGPFGYNWDHNYNVYLRQLNNGSIAVNTGYLQEDIYFDSGDSNLYNPPRGVFAKLERAQNSDFILTFKGGMKWYFEDAGFERIPLIKIEDTNKNSQQLIYNSKNQLETVIDTVGRKINFIYGSCGLLEALHPECIQEQGKPPKEIIYMHANNIEQLSAVITFPTPDFPNGLMTCYEYDDFQALAELRNNILRVIDAKGQVIVENFYGTDTTDNSFNRVIKQYFMGGEYLFKYTNIRYIPPFDDYINDAFLQTEFYEPERPLKVFTFNFRGNLLDERFRLCADGSYQIWSQSYRYNKNGQMTEFYYANGMADFYEYYEHDPNNPLSVAERDGNLLRVLKYNTTRALIPPVPQAPRVISEFTYEDNFQKIKSVKDEAGSITQFEYDAKGNLLKLIYPDTTLPDGTLQNNCQAIFKYDGVGQLLEEISPEGRKKSYDYINNGNGAGLVKKVTAFDNISPLVKLFEYDALGNIKKAVDGFGNDTLFEHNLIGQLVKTELPAVNGTRAVYKFEYNEDRKVAKEYLPKGNYNDAVLNDQFIINEYFYDVASWLVEVKKYSNTASPQTTKIQRDYFGNVIKLLNPIGQEFRNKYDDRNLILEEIRFSNSEFPLKTKYDYDRLGSLKSVTHPDGNIETFSYDSFARLTSQINHLGVVQEFSYGNRDKVIKKVIQDSLNSILQTHTLSFDEKGRLKTSDINGLTSQLYYDKDDLTIKTINHQNNAIKINYDGIGRTILVTDPLGNKKSISYDANGNVSSSGTQTTLNGNIFSINQQVFYDERNRQIITKDPLGNEIRFIYDDRNLRTGVINALGQQVNLFYDINGQTIKSCLLRGQNEIIINQWNRDLIGRLDSYQDAENNLTKYFYDERNNLTKTQYSDNSTINKEYDSFGFLKKEIDCNGTITNFSYNPKGQLTQMDFQVNGGAIQTPQVTYGYDSFGRNNSVARGTHTILKKFDNFNRLIEEKQGTETIKKVFDDINNSVALSFPDGRIDKYKLDELGRIKEVVFEKQGTANCLINDFAEGTILSAFEYEGLFLIRKKYANQSVTEYSYDIEGKLSGLNVKDSLGNTIDGEKYLFDADKRKKIIIRDSFPNTNKYFNYDELSRLTESYTGLNAVIPNNLNDQQSIDNFLNGLNLNAAAHVETYSLSDNDKRTGWNIDGVQFNMAYNNLLQLNSVSGGANINYLYDKNGNRISDDVFNYFYDAFDNLVKVERKADNFTLFEHSYDGEGRIIERKENNTSNLFYYDGLRSIQEQPQSGNSIQNAFGLGLDEYIVQSKGQSNYFFHQNSILSLSSITDKNGNPLQYFDFSSFGLPSVFDSGKNITSSSNSLVSILFSGRPQISLINKYDFRKRIYDQEIGLYFQRDSFQYFDSSNSYFFCKHNPNLFTDPTGGIIPLLVAIGILSAEGGLTVLGTAVVTGAAIGGLSGIGINASRQVVQIQSGEGRDEKGNPKQFSVGEVLFSGLIGTVGGGGLPLLLASSIGWTAPVIAGGLIYKGIEDVVQEIADEEYYTAGFDIASSVILPFAGKKIGGLNTKNNPNIIDEVYTLQGDKNKIFQNPGKLLSELKGRLWGQTEGSVYAHELPNAPRWMSGANPKNDPVIFQIKGPNAATFKDHEVTGFYSLLKRVLGQKKSGFGDINFDGVRNTGTFQSVPKPGGGTQLAPVFELLNVESAQGNFSGQSTAKALSRLWGRRVTEHLLNVPIMAGVNNLPNQILSPSDKN
ncbi:MAG: DUF6531 domain-containing protein [Bacteroidetes bacterium]|nr:DUF6531 domain-containing protein [Bacteroidota bacterium]